MMCWQGGTSYVEGDKLDLNLGGMPLAELCERLKPRCRFIALKLPLNFNLEGACVCERRRYILRMVWGFQYGYEQQVSCLRRQQGSAASSPRLSLGSMTAALASSCSSCWTLLGGSTSGAATTRETVM